MKIKESMRIISLALIVLGISTFVCAQTYDFSKVPGVVIDHSSASSKVYLGTPSICILPDGTYVVSHDLFNQKERIVKVFESKDKGKNWEQIAEMDGFWCGLFMHRGELFMMGADQERNCIIRKSTDGGHSWTEPKSSTTGLIRLSDFEKGYHTSAVSVIEAKGRIWRPFEVYPKKWKWGDFEAFVLSAPADSDLLNAENWRTSTRMSVDAAWGNDYHCWLEGGAVLSPEGEVLNILRVDRRDVETAAIMHVADDGVSVSFDPEKDFIEFPGGCKRFVIRYDEKSKRYWSLTNWVPEKFKGHIVERTRNTLALVSSADLRKWTVNKVVLQDDNVDKSGFQYVDWLVDGNDIVLASRTAFFDGVEYADNQHNSNFITFHRIDNFREFGENEVED